MKLPHIIFATILGVCTTQAAIIYQQNFESATLGAPPTGWSGTGAAVETTGGFSAFGFGSQHLRNTASGAPTSTLTLSGLATHTSITISFDLIVWDTMDVNKLFTVVANGVTLPGYPIDSSNFSNGNPSGFTGPGTLVSGNVGGDSNTPNFGNNSQRDQGRRVGGITFNHSTSTLTISFGYTGNVTGSTDESFGIDNIIVSDNNPDPNGSAIPEPSTFVLASCALAGLATLRKRK